MYTRYNLDDSSSKAAFDSGQALIHEVVGLDISSFDIKICILNGEGEKLDSFSVNNDFPSATTLKDRLLQHISNQEVEILKIGLESISVYSFQPSMFFHYDEDLQRFGAKIFLMNLKQIANFKKSYSDMDKTGEIDVFVIAITYGSGGIDSVAQNVSHQLKRLFALPIVWIRSWKTQLTSFSEHQLR